MAKVKIKKCPTCGTENDFYAQSCKVCGRKLRELALVKICPSCLSTNSVDDQFCTVCGISLGDVIGSQPLVHEKLPQIDLPEHELAPEDEVDHHPFHTKSIISPTRPTRKKRWITFVSISIVISITFVIISLFSIIGIKSRYAGSNNVIPTSLASLGEFKASNGELLGVNDGSFPSFVLGPDGSLKQQATNQLNQGHRSQAISLWQAAIHVSNNDAEAAIYLENQLVLLSNQPYVTLVAGTDLFEVSGSGQNDLQGIYVAQHEFNNANHGFRLRILIANSGNDINNVTNIAQQIVHIAAKDKTVVGVISWSTSGENINALQPLAAAHIPMISPKASSDLLTNSSPFFFRIVPPNKIQGKQTALFAEKTLHAHKVVVFLDPSDPYSQNLSQVFEKQFRQDGQTILKEEVFTTDDTNNIGGLIQDALRFNPDLLYFTSSSLSDISHFQEALPTSGPFAHLPALAGDSGHTLQPAGYGRWYFVSFGFANAAENAIGTNPPPFYQDYSNAFNKDGRKPAGYYGYTRPDTVAMLSYDVTSVFLKAIQQALINKITVPSDNLQLITPTLLANTLPDVVLQGVTGQITFGSDHDPINKAIIFLIGTSKGFSMIDWRGCFSKNICRA